MAEAVVSAAMRQMDNAKGKLIFVWTAIDDDLLRRQESGSGREVRALGLQPLPLPVIFSPASAVVDAALLTKCKEVPAVHQLVLSCAGHPRACFDGLRSVTEEVTGIGCDQQPTGKVAVARHKIIEKCKFSQRATLTAQDLSSYYSLPGWTPAEKASGVYRGVLHQIDNGKRVGHTLDFFLPLIVQEWAAKNRETTFGHHIDELFACDLVLEPGGEKFMEGVMYHWEAVLRKANEGKRFTLGAFYQSEHIGKKFKEMTVTVKVPPRASLVAYVDDFSDIDEVIRLLIQGFIVVSRKWKEVGVEYLVPYLDADDGSLIVAAVQCKFVTDSTNWAQIKKKMRTAVDGLKKKRVKYFPVVYTTADQKSMMEETYDDGIYFVEKDLFRFTSKLGVLRMHTEKLGNALAKEYPAIFMQ